MFVSEKPKAFVKSFAEGSCSKFEPILQWDPGVSKKGSEGETDDYRRWVLFHVTELHGNTPLQFLSAQVLVWEMMHKLNTVSPTLTRVTNSRCWLSGRQPRKVLPQTNHVKAVVGQIDLFCSLPFLVGSHCYSHRGGKSIISTGPPNTVKPLYPRLTSSALLIHVRRYFDISFLDKSMDK